MKVISVLSFVYGQRRVGPVGLVNIYSEEELIASLFTRIGFSSHTYFARSLLAFPNDFWGRKWNPCFADKQQSGTLALTSCSNFSIEALTLTRLSLTSLGKTYTLNFPSSLGVKRAVSVCLRTSQTFWYVCLVLGNCSLRPPLTSPTLSTQATEATDCPRGQVKKKLGQHKNSSEHKTLLFALSSHHTILHSSCLSVERGGVEAKVTGKTELW